MYVTLVCARSKTFIIAVLYNITRTRHLHAIHSVVLTIITRDGLTPSSDPVFLLEYMENIESDISDDEFDGYIDEEGGVCGGVMGNNDRDTVAR